MLSLLWISALIDTWVYTCVYVQLLCECVYVRISMGMRVKFWVCVKLLQALSVVGKWLARWCYGRLKWQEPSPWAFYHAIKSQIWHPMAILVHIQTRIGLRSALLPRSNSNNVTLPLSQCSMFHCAKTFGEIFTPSFREHISWIHCHKRPSYWASVQMEN